MVRPGVMLGKEYYFQAPERKRLEYKRAKRFTRYWRKVERKFRLRRLIGISRFTLKFRHAPFSGFTFDDEWTIENIANYYDYHIRDEILSGEKSTYMFVSRQ